MITVLNNIYIIIISILLLFILVLIIYIKKLKKLNLILNENIINLNKNLKNKDKSSILGEMFGRISHEIKNPLSVILANIQMLKIDIGEIKNIEKKELKNLLEMANAIEEASRLGRNIVGNVVNYSRKESDADYKVNLNEVIDSVNSFMRKDLEINGINLKIKLEENLNILAKRSEIIQVFLNLIINAKDSILENKNIKDKKIGIYAEKKGELITIIIKDNGVGIKKEVGNKIFEPFYTTKIINKGTGLGLSIVKEILNRYNAVIYVESVEEKETKFIINFINYKKN